LLDRRRLQFRRRAILLDDGETLGAMNFVGVNMLLEKRISLSVCNVVLVQRWNDLLAMSKLRFETDRQLTVTSQGAVDHTPQFATLGTAEKMELSTLSRSTPLALT
jgi:hypothetical protein